MEDEELDRPPFRGKAMRLGDEWLPAMWAICVRCDGEGHHGNPAFDGTTTAWWLEGDPDGDDLESYMTGKWDVQCTECAGAGKVLVFDESRATSDQIKFHAEWERDEAESRQMERMERMMGA